MRRGLGTALLLLAACEEAEFFGLPEVEGASAILVRVEGTDRVAAQAFGDPLLVDLRDDDHALVLSAYRESPAELGLTPGAVEPRSCRSCALLAPLAVFELDAARAGNPWRLSEQRSDPRALAQALPDADRCDTCATFEPTSLLRADGRAFSGALAIAGSEGRALVFDPEDGALYWVRAEGPPELACRGEGVRAISAAYAESESIVWTAGAGGALSRWEPGLLDPSTPCELGVTLTSTPAGEPMAWIDGAPPGAPHEVFAIAGSGQVYRYFDGAWERIDTPLEGYGHTSVWIGPGRGMASTLGRRNLWYADGLFQATVLVLDAYEVQIGSARRFDDVGLVLGNKPFILLFEDGAGGFRRAAPLLPIGETVQSFARHRGSYFMAMSDATVRELHPRRDYCDAQPVFPLGSSARHMVAHPDGTLLVSTGALWRLRRAAGTTCQ